MEGLIVDVREPKEFRDGNLPTSINLPSTKFEIEQFEPYRNNVINLICETGKRAKTIKTKLDEKGFENVFILNKQMADIQVKVEMETKNIWSVDRQFRLLLGLLLATFLIGNYFGIIEMVAIPLILSTGLIFTAIIDRCYLRMGIAMLPWNKKRKV